MTAFGKRLLSFYTIIQILSFDVVAGAMATGYLAIRLLHVEANPLWWVVIPFAVWSFYTTDHLIDGFKLKGDTGIPRHSFHYKNRHLLGALSVFFALTAFVLSLIFLEKQIIQLGLVTGAVVLGYFVVLSLFGKKKTFILQKEFVIALVYVSGIWLAPLVWYGRFPEATLIVVPIVLFLLAWAEGIMASWFDYENDVKDSHSSFTVLFGKQNTRRFLIILHILVVLIIIFASFYIINNLEFAALLILALMNLTLLLIMLQPTCFHKNERYRIVGEAVFLLPGFLIFV